MKEPKIAGFALVDYFNGDVLRELGTCLYQKSITPIVISLKKGRNVVDEERTIMTEVDLTFARARTHLDALVVADDHSFAQLKSHGPFKKLVEKMISDNQLVIAMGEAPTILADLSLAKDRKITGNKKARQNVQKAGANVVDEPVVVDNNLITAKSIEYADKVCAQIVNLLARAA